MPQNGTKRRPPKQKRNLKKIAFNFKYWRQRDYFGLGGEKCTWFISVLERLGELSSVDAHTLSCDSQLRDALRHHDLNFENATAPFNSKEDLFNAVNFPYKHFSEAANQDIEISQFQVSTANGRIIGSFLENIFYVFLLDPGHNAQPSAYNNYKLNKTTVGLTEYQRLEIKFIKIQNLIETYEKNKFKDSEGIMKDISTLIRDEFFYNGYLIYLEVGVYEEIIFKFLKHNPKESLYDAILEGMLLLDDELSKKEPIATKIDD